MMDCSHSGYRTSLDVMEQSTKPVVFSHANARALTDHPRNIRDEQLRACARTGGVVGVTAIGVFLGVDEVDELPQAMLRQIDYLAEMIGTDHIGLGFDLGLMPGVKDAEPANQEDWWPARWYGSKSKIARGGPSLLPALIEPLQARYGEAAMRGILGGNFERVARACWRD